MRRLSEQKGYIVRNLNLSILRVTALLLGAVLFGVTPPHVIASAGTYFVDGNKGNDANPGSAALPWRTLKKATASIQPGDTVIFARGIYRVSGVLLLFSPDGLDANHPTTFKAAAGARVIFTGPGDEPVNVKVGDTRGGAYVRIEGLWFGGKWDQVNDHSVDVSGIPIGEGIQIVNCTIFGYRSGLISGATENLLVQGDRFIHNGDGGLNHAIYLSGSDGIGSARRRITSSLTTI